MENQAVWTCPTCGHKFRKANTQHTCERHGVEDHLRKATAHTRALNDELLALARECGEFFEEATKTRISL